jgi:REP element-mobilizing transposase RayT
MKAEDFGPPMDAPLAYFLTWATYGTWLPGDQRGWVEYRRGRQMPDPAKQLEAAARMSENACLLDEVQRDAVHQQVAETCRYKGWKLHAVNCRTNHIHIVVTALARPKNVRVQLKAWCTRKLKTLQQTTAIGEFLRDEWWAERGSQRYINDQASLETVILYVLDGQDGAEQDRRKSMRVGD